VRFGRSVRLFAVALGLALIALPLHPTPGLAKCDPDDDACLEQEGNNEAEVDIDAEGQGGDAIAGSQVISVTGSGDTQITANNRSRFARAKGGDVKGTVETTINNGPRVQVERDSSSTNAVVGGLTQITQDARPTVRATLDQFSLPTGTPTLSSTAFATGSATGTNVFSQAPSGAGGVTQTIDQMVEAPVTSSVTPDVGIEADNQAIVTGVAPVSQAATARVSPAALAFGGGSAMAVATAVVPITQEASPSVSISLDQIASPTGLALVSTSARSFVDLSARNEATGAGGPIDQSITQAGSSPVSNTVAPAINVTAANAATIVGSSPVNQLATARTSPSAVAFADGLPATSAMLRQVGDNVQDVDVDMAFVGGDAIAGSNVVGVAGAGATSVVATNDSLFASAEGGDTQSVVNTFINSGPRLFVNAMGISGEGQTAATATPDPGADPDAAPQLGSLLSTVLTRTGVTTRP
jgi:hypothetical protein